MSGLRREAEEYLALRRSLGFKLRGYDRLLTDFIDHLEGMGRSTVTSDAALAWATGRADVSPLRWAQRLSAVRGFARHLHGLDPAVEVPPVDLLPCQRTRRVPYLYADADTEQLLAAPPPSGLLCTRRRTKPSSACWPSRACASGRRSASTATTSTWAPD